MAALGSLDPVTLLWCDRIGAALSLWATYQYTQGRRVAWIWASLAVLLHLILYTATGIYGKVFLDLAYLAIDAYGWIRWGSSMPTPGVRTAWVRRLGPRRMLLGCLAVLPLAALAVTVLHTVFHSSIALADGICVAYSLLAQVWLSQRWIECWILWSVVDCVSLWLVFQKGLYWHTAAHAAYPFLALYAYWHWSRVARSP